MRPRRAGTDQPGYIVWALPSGDRPVVFPARRALGHGLEVVGAGVVPWSARRADGWTVTASVVVLVPGRLMMFAARRDGRVLTWTWPSSEAAAICLPECRRRPPGVPAPTMPARSHPPPAAGCDCGFRVTEDLHELMQYISWGESYVPWSSLGDYRRRMLTGQRGGNQLETGFSRWARGLGQDYFCDRRHWGVLDVPDVVGRVVGMGRRLRSPTDLPSTWLCASAKVGDRLYLSPQLWRAAEELARYYSAEVVVGSTLGLPWLAEVEQYEADHPRGASAGSVVYLAPSGSVPPPGAQADGPGTAFPFTENE